MIVTQGKLVMAGNIWTHWKFQRALIIGKVYSRYPRVRKRLVGSLTSARSRRLSSWRSIRKVFDLVCSNVYQYRSLSGKIFNPVFYTLTMREVESLDYSHGEFKLFIKRLNYRFKLDLKYLAVVEWQKRGAVHYHMIIFNMPFIPYKELDKLWSHGSATIKLIRSEMGLATYMTKELTKTFKTNELDNRKRYFCSKDLLKPVVEYDEVEIEKILSYKEKSKIIKNDSYVSTYQGAVEMIQYQLL